MGIVPLLLASANKDHTLTRHYCPHLPHDRKVYKLSKPLARDETKKPSSEFDVAPV